CHLRERLIQRGRGKSKALDACLFAQSLMKCLPHDNTNVFDRVVLVDVEVALRMNGQIEKAMLGQQLEHMIEEPDTGVDLSLAAAVKRPFDTNVGFFRRTMQ